MSKRKSNPRLLPVGSENKLVAFSAGPLDLKSENGEKKDLPTRLLVFPWGENQTNKGRLIVNETTAAVLAHNQDAAKYDRIAFDFQHNTVKATPDQEPVKVAGYGVPEVVVGEGIYLSAIEYTDEGKDVLPGGHYPDISPAVKPNKAGEVVFMHSVGAVRQGEIDGLQLFEPNARTSTAFEMLEANGIVALEADGETDYRKVLIGLLSSIGIDIDEDTEGSDLVEAIAEARTKISTPAKKAESPESPDPTQPIETMSADAKKLEERIVALEADKVTDQRQVILNEAKRDGKVIPLSAERLKDIDPAILRDMVDQLPKGQVPLESETEGAADGVVALSAGGAPEAVQNEVNSQLGLTEEDFKKYAS